MSDEHEDGTPEAKAGGHHPLGVLLVEDDEEHARHVKDRLRKAGITNPVMNVDTAEEAYRYLSGKGRYQGMARPKPAIILLDITLPDAHGSEFLEFLKQHHRIKEMPVVVLTDSDTTQSPTALRGLGAAGIIEKPLSLDQFLRTVEAVGSKDWLQFERAAGAGGGIEVED